MSTALRSSKDYGMFDRSKENRPVELGNRRILRSSMELHGWVKAYPMHVTRGANNRLVIIDGQHRFEIAKELGIPVWFVETENHVDVAMINNAQRKWAYRDYAGSFAQRGNQEYIKLLEFADRHQIPVLSAVTMLSGTSSSNKDDAYKSGTWKISSTGFADRVVIIFNEIKKFNKAVCKENLITSISTCCRVYGFQDARMIQAVNRCPEKLMTYSTSSALVEMLEDIYNFGRRDIFPLKIEAEKILRQRSCLGSKISK